MKKLCVLKIGGSVATYKESPIHTVREDVLPDIFTTLAILQKKQDIQLILIHGAGGHVHHLAHTFDLTTGTQGNPVKTAGALETQAAVTHLHNEIIKIGVTCGLSLQSIPTHSVITQTDRKIHVCSTQQIKNVLGENGIPVLYGDMVVDTTLGMSVCSGDAVAAYLCTVLPVTHMFFATDVDGIYTHDPHTDSTATLVEWFSFSDSKRNVFLTQSHNKDTTGGLQGKMKECSTLFDTSSTLKELHIFNGLHSENYRKVLCDEVFPHSHILK